MMTRVHMLLLLLVTRAQASCDIPLIQWTAGCNVYDVTEGVKPGFDPIYTEQDLATVSECRSLCTANTECGGFTWEDGVTITLCWLYNTNDQIINQYLTAATKAYQTFSYSTWYSKTCSYDTGASDLSCSSYSNTVPVNTYVNAYFMPAVSTDLTSTHCQGWCTLHTSCRSVTYLDDTTTGKKWCLPHETTVEELWAAGQNSSVRENTLTGVTYTNYVRLCTSRYLPACPTTTTQVPTTSTQVAPSPSSGIRLISSAWGITVTAVIVITTPLSKLGY